MNLKELEHLKMLLALTLLAELKNQDAVAAKMEVSQPSISRWKKKLEDYYSPEKLFLVEDAEGEGESWVPTPFLESLMFLVDGMKQRYHTLSTRDTSKEITGTYKVYLSPAAVSTFGEMLIDALIEECPNVNWIVEGADTDKVRYGLSEQDVAFAIHVALNNLSPHILSKKIIKAKRKIFARKGHPILLENSVDFATLEKYEFVAVDIGIGHTAHESMSVFNSVQPNPKYTVETLNSAAHLIKKHDAICVGGLVYFGVLDGIEIVDNLHSEVANKLEEVSKASATHFYAHKDDPNLVTWARIIRKLTKTFADKLNLSELFDNP